MKNIFTAFNFTSFVLIFFILSPCSFLCSQTFVGDKTLSTQMEVDDFGANYTSITGDLMITSFLVSNVDALTTITSIGGSFTISSTSLTEVDGFENLTSIGGSLQISNNGDLTSVEGFASLTSLQNALIITRNDVLTNVNGFLGITSIQENTLNISDNAALADLSGFANITSLGGSLIIDNNDALTNVDGLLGLQSIVGGCGLRNNDALANVDGFANLSTIGGQLTISGNPSLTDLSGFSGLSSVCCLIIRDNDALISIDGFNGLNSLIALSIDFNDELVEIDGFNNLSTTDYYLNLLSNPSLTSFDGFNNLNTVGRLSISRNTSLTILGGFSSLSSIDEYLFISNNSSLTEIQDFDNLVFIGDELRITNNKSLSNCCTLVHLIDDDPNNGTTNGPINISGNADGCNSIADIMANCALPPSWQAAPDGINCADGNEVSYDPNTDTFIITSEGCYDPSYYPTSDSHGFVYTELCGDGEIIAEIQSVSGNGWAGVSMRESTDPGAKMLQLLIDGVFLTRRQLRTSTNGMAFNHQFQTQGKNWLRLTRSGGAFTAQHSTDGINWSTVIATTISMPNCIPVGLVTMNNQANGTLAAVFGNVEVKSNTALHNPNTPDIAETDPRYSIYPNPASEQLWIKLPNHVSQGIKVTVHNPLGQQVLQRYVTVTDPPLLKLDLTGWHPGAYLVEIVEKEERHTKRLIIGK